MFYQLRDLNNNYSIENFESDIIVSKLENNKLIFKCEHDNISNDVNHKYIDSNSLSIKTLKCLLDDGVEFNNHSKYIYRKCYEKNEFDSVKFLIDNNIIFYALDQTWCENSEIDTKLIDFIYNYLHK